MRKFILLLLVSLVLTSCGEKFISSVDLGVEAKPVIGCFLVPGDTLISVSVTMSNLLYSRNPNVFKVRNDAVVRLLSNGQVLNLTYDTDREKYVKLDSTFVVAGQNYRLEVELDGLQHAAETTVPQAYNDTISLELIPVYRNWGTRTDTSYSFQKRWQAPATGPYYFGSAILVENYVNDTLISIYPADDDGYSPIRLLLYSSSTPFRQFQRTSTRSFGSFREANSKYRFTAELLLTDLSFYRYSSSLEAHWYNAGEFFVEPSPVYSSFDNALGVFGSFVRSRAYTPFF